jgi:hypothetical protein
MKEGSFEITENRFAGVFNYQYDISIESEQ